MGIVLEIAIILLLAVTCGYCLVLNRRLEKLRAGQKDLIEHIKKFDHSSRRAEKNLASLQRNSAVIGRDLKSITRKAEHLSMELSVIVEAGDNIADRIEQASRRARNQTCAQREDARDAA